MDYMESVILDEVSKLTKVLGFRSKVSDKTGNYEKSIPAPPLRTTNNIVDVGSSLGTQNGDNYEGSSSEIKANSIKTAVGPTDQGNGNRELSHKYR